MNLRGAPIAEPYFRALFIERVIRLGPPPLRRRRSEMNSKPMATNSKVSPAMSRVLDLMPVKGTVIAV